MSNLTRKDKNNPTPAEVMAEYLEANRGADPRNTWQYAVEMLLPLMAQEFTNWVAINRAFNGSEYPHAQSLYNECLNAELPEWARQWTEEVQK